LGREAVLKRILAINYRDQTRKRRSVMVAIILNSIYRQFLRSSLPGMNKSSPLP